jgi:hypothetical protein
MYKTGINIATLKLSNNNSQEIEKISEFIQLLKNIDTDDSDKITS